MTPSRASTLLLTVVLGVTACTGTPTTDGEVEEGVAEPATTLALTDLQCGEGAPIAEQLSNGSIWSMCWHIAPKRGLVLTDVHYAPPGREPVSVIASLSLGQLEVPYDSGERLTEDITSAGFGGTAMQTLTDTDCTGTSIATAVPNIGDGTHGDSPVREVLCSEVRDAGLSYRLRDGAEVMTARRTDWSLTTISKVAWYEYLTVYTFGADGSIRPTLGATGDLSPVDYTDSEHGAPVGSGESDHAASHSHNVVWRVHWALGGRGDLAVEQYDARPTGEMGSEAPIIDGRLTPVSDPVTAQWTDRRWWRVLAPQVLNDDDHPISYEIDLADSDGFTFVRDQERHGADTGYDVAFTNYDECEIFATANRGACGDGVLDYVENGAGEPLDDVVSWVAVGYHHVPRDEDQSPMELHWQGFAMTPRDLMAQRPDVPEGRENVNGQPDDTDY